VSRRNRERFGPVSLSHRLRDAAGASFENGELREATLYTALQPCGMCTTAAIWSKVGRNVFGAGREDVHKMYFERPDRGRRTARFQMPFETLSRWRAA
jgi:tRNA(Arg) A34 adenosine deaminase TadA